MKTLNWLFLSMLSIYFGACKADAKPLEVITPELYLSTNISSERKALVDSIISQFQNMPIITQSQVDSAIIKAPNLAAIRIQIVDQKVYGEAFSLESRIIRHRSTKFISYLQALLSKYKIDDVDFIVHLGDGLNFNFPEVPSFIMSKDTNSPYEANLLLLPDEYMMDKGWNKTVEQISAARAQYPWDHKENKIFWRGATTGGIYNIDNLDKLPRLSLVRLSNSHPNLINAKFSSYCQIEPSESGHELQKMLDTLSAAEGVKKVKEAEHLKYKYLISIDGNTCAWKRVPWIMLSNSILIKQETAKTQWFYPAIKPYVHYVPVNESLNDLFSQFEWLKTHDIESQQISINAHEFIKNELMPEHIEAHMVLILNEFHKLYGEKIIKPSLLKATDLLIHMENLEYKDLSIWDSVKFFFKSSRRKLKSIFTELTF